MNENELKDIIIKLVKEKQWLEDQYNRELTERENSDIIVSKMDETFKRVKDLSLQAIWSNESECREVLIKIVNILGEHWNEKRT